MTASFSKLTVACAAMVLVACGQPAIIDRTQPNYIKKSDLTSGTWYIHESVVDAPKTLTGATVIGSSSEMEKIRWEIQEDMLVAYRSYEVVAGADPRVDRAKSSIGHVVTQDGKPYKGNPVYAYKITSHFDRQRQYNASTGEQSNVLLEDTADRPWNEREYIRVNWGSSLIRNESACNGPYDHGKCLHGLVLPHFISSEDARAEDSAPTFERDSSGALTYFDFTSQLLTEPPSIYYPGYGRLPYCLFNPQVDCETANIKVRTSVMKVDEAHVTDYEPLVYGEKLMKKFGFFRNETYAYNRDYYYTESGRQLFAMRHDIWKQSKEPMVDANGNQVVDAVTGYQKLQTIPVSKRALKPVVYYMTENTPRSLWGAATMRHAQADGFNPKDTIEASWDHSFRRTVAVPRGLEANDIPQMFYICESPVPAGAPEACGKPGTYARIGDLRYNIIPYVEQNAGGLLGLGPSAMDPETGEVVHAAANVYGLGIDTWSGGSQQIIDVVNGDLSIEKLVTGQDQKDYVFSNLNATDARRPLSGPWQSQQGLTADPTKPTSTFMKTSGHLADLMAVWKSQGSMPVQKQNRRAVVEQLLAKNPALENELINLPEVKLGLDSLVTDSAFKAKLSGDPAFMHQVARNMLLGIDPIEDARSRAKNTPDPTVGCLFEASYDDPDYVGLAKRKKKLYGELVTKLGTSGNASCANQSSCTPDEAATLARTGVWDSLRREAYRSVTTHEIGHTLGLMHNFIGSADALNYQDGYWDLRKDTIGVQVGGKRVLAVTPQNMLDATKPNQRQLDNDMYEYTYSTIMDYGARVNSTNMGTGKYDDAAILFAYSGGFEPGWVEVFNQMRTDYDQPNISVPVDNQAKVFTVRGAHVEIPVAIAEHYTPVSSLYTDKYHYSTLPFHFADQSASFETMLDQGIARMNSRSFRRWSEMSAHYARLEVALKDFNLSQAGLQQSDYVRARDIINMAGGAAIPAEVPYMYCSDYEVGANLMCNRHDQGADVYEMTSKWVERFNQSYVFSNFRRDRLMYSPASVASGKFGRYLGNIPNVYQQWLFNIYGLSNYLQLAPEELDKFYGLGDPLWQNYWTMAVVDSTNTLMQQLAVPSIGYHGRRADGTWVSIPTTDNQNRRLGDAAEAEFVTRMKLPANGGYSDVLYVPRGAGRSMFSVHDTFGYDNYSRVNEAGHFWDVYASMLALTTSETNFLGVDRGSDALKYSLPYYTTFNRELAPLFSAYWAETPEVFAPMLGKNPDGTGSVVLPTFLRSDTYVYGFNYPPAATPPVDANGAPMVMSKVLPTPTWSSRFYAQLWGMAFFTTNFNLEYAEYSKVYRLGSSEALTPAAGFDVIKFDDPFGGGYIYAALQKQGDTSNPAGPVMVSRAAAQTDKWKQACRLDKGLPPNATVDLPCRGGTGTNKVDGKSTAQWESDVRESVRSLEMMRGLYDIFGRAL